MLPEYAIKAIDQRSSSLVLEVRSPAQFGDFQAQRHLIQLAFSSGIDDPSYRPPLHY